MSRKQKLTLFIILIVYTGIFASVSIVNHYFFRTHAHDLGIETNTIFDYAHLRVNDCMLMQPQFNNVLSDHFSLLPMLYSPLIYIFGSYTLLIVQILFVLLGGYGIFKYVSFKTKDNWLGILATVHFFSLWGIYSALAFDAHNNVMAAMIVPWFFYFFEKGQLKKAFLFFALVISAKENMALWTLFIAVGLLFVNYKNKERRNFLLMMAVTSVVYFVTVMQFIMPALANDGRAYLHFEYHALGNNFGEVVVNIIKHPIKTFSLFFENHSDEAIYDTYKSELHFIILLSGGIALFLRPQFLIMLIPIYAQKLFSDDSIKWGLGYHYSIEFVPIISIALFTFINDLKLVKIKFATAFLGITTTIFCTIYTVNHAQSIPYLKEELQFTKAIHYKRNFNINNVYDLMKLIPPNAKVSASNVIAPHLSLRDFIYLFPVVQNAEYIILLDDGDAYPLSAEQMKTEITKLMTSPEWKLEKQEGIVYLFRKR